MIRDVNERGRTFENVVAQYFSSVQPMYDEIVKPSSMYADLIINNDGVENLAIEVLTSVFREELKNAKELALRKEEARRKAEEQRRAEEQRVREQQEAEKRRIEDERRQAEAERNEQKKREEAESRRAELESKTAEVQEKLDKLKTELEDLRSREEEPQIRDTARELERLTEMMGSKKYLCYDFCIVFQKIEFRRIMKTRKVRPNQNGYYTVLYDISPKYGHKYEKVDVSYTCDRHQQTWTQSSVDEYRRGFVPKRQLEAQISRLRSSLGRLRKAAAVKRQAEESALKSEIAKVSAELAELKKAAEN